MAIKLRKADVEFSKYIRTRDKWTCQRCKKRYEPPTQALHCSHFWGRGRENTRFDPDNCDALCYGCHKLWGHGDGRGDYIEFKQRQLGMDGYKALQIRAHTYRKKDDKLILLWLKKITI